MSSNGRRITGRRSRTATVSQQRQREKGSSSVKEKVQLPFDARALVEEQNPNEDAPALDLEMSTDLTPVRALSLEEEGTTEREAQSCTDALVEISDPHFITYSLDDLFGPELGFSRRFASDGEFREAMRRCIRKDVFRSTPAYERLSPSAAIAMFQPDSSLQGSWLCGGTGRMARLTQVLRDALGATAPTGDDFMDTIGSLCGREPSTHWIDIIGVKDRALDHSWHQDTGTSLSSSKTVMLGFPAEDCYDGTGVFSHVVKLRHEHHSHASHPANEPVLFKGGIDENYVVRPRFAEGREILVYRDIDVLHSAPDITYRSSVMRFM